MRANLIYSLNGGDRYEEWFCSPAKLAGANKAIAKLPKATTHYFLNLIDENNFLRSHPEVLDPKQPSKAEVGKFSTRALSVRPAAQTGKR